MGGAVGVGPVRNGGRQVNGVGGVSGSGIQNGCYALCKKPSVLFCSYHLGSTMNSRTVTYLYKCLNEACVCTYYTLL